MAAKPSKSPKSDSQRTGKGKQKVTWQGYVNLSLTDAQKSGFEAWAATADVWGDEIPRVLDSGYTVSLAHDDYSDSMIAGLYCINASDANAGWKLTAHGGEVETALVRLMYIHFVLLEGDWSQDFRPGLDAW